jgi:hypothetical protein
MFQKYLEQLAVSSFHDDIYRRLLFLGLNQHTRVDAQEIPNHRGLLHDFPVKSGCRSRILTVGLLEVLTGLLLLAHRGPEPFLDGLKVFIICLQDLSNDLLVDPSIHRAETGILGQLYLPGGRSKGSQQDRSVNLSIQPVSLQRTHLAVRDYADAAKSRRQERLEPRFGLPICYLGSILVVTFRP